MKKILTVCTLTAAMIALVLGFLNLIGMITTHWNWISFSMVLIMLFMSSEQFLIKGEPKKIRNARILGVVMLLTSVLNLLVFIKSVLI